MWTQEHRERFKQLSGRYPSDMTHEEWAVIEPLVPPAKPGRRPRGTDMRAALNAISCCAPAALGAICRGTGSRRARRSTTSSATCRRTGRGRRSGRICTWTCVSISGGRRGPSAAILDSQSLKAAETYGPPRRQAA